MCFLYWKRNDILDVIELMDGKSLQLRKRGRGDREIKKLRDSFYVQELVVLLFTYMFGVLFLTLVFSLVLIFTRPLQLVIPFALEIDAVLTGPSTTYWIVYALELVLSALVAMVMPLCDCMLGNLYSQLILHLEVLHYDIRALNEDVVVTSGLMTQRFCEFIRTYQELHQLSKRFEQCMRPFFINNVIATAFATTFACVEMGIMVNVDVRECVKPFLYFLFITFPFFYWCWLGNRVNEKSSGLARTVFIYNENCSDLTNQKLQLLFIHMVQEPMVIIAKPFVTLNFDIFVTLMKVAYQFTAVLKNFYK